MAGAHGVDAILEMAKKYSGGDRYIRLEDGDSVTVAFLGDPFSREVVWLDGKTENYDENNPVHKKEEPRMLVSWNCWDREKQIMRVFDQGVTFFRRWLKNRDKFGLNRWYEIEREGKKKKTTYNLYKGDEIPAEEWAELCALKLITLERTDDDDDDDDDDDSEGRRPAAKSNNDRPAAKSSNGKSESKEPAFIHQDIARDLVARLKELPPENVGTFLKKFNVERIKEVPHGSGPAAIAFVEGLESLAKGSHASTKTVDPFA